MIWMFASLAAQAVQGSLQYGRDAQEQKRQNKVDIKYNEAVRTASARQITEINLQRTAARAQTAQALDAARKQGQVETSSRNLQAAATDTMGASVDQNLQEVEVQLAAAESNLMQNAELTELSLDSSVHNTVDQARNSIRDLSNPLGSDYAAAGAAVGQLGTSVVANKLSGQGWFGGKPGQQQPAPITQAVGTPTNNLSTRLNL